MSLNSIENSCNDTQLLHKIMRNVEKKNQKYVMLVVHTKYMELNGTKTSIDVLYCAEFE